MDDETSITEYFDNGDDEERALLSAARTGPLADYLAVNPVKGSQALYRLVAKLVFEYVTRPVERGRDHSRCAASADKLLPECHDAYQDDVEAVYEYVLRNSARSFENLAGWINTRLKHVTIDAYRKRRGECGALQKPRLTAWLRAELGDDPWLRRLALNILEWVGVTATVPGGMWPTGAWAQQRALVTGEPSCTESQIAADIELVLRAMRTRPSWFEKYVERPMGRKQAPLLQMRRDVLGRPDDVEYLTWVAVDETAEALLTQLAWAAVEVIERRLGRGDDMRETVVEVIGEVFGATTGVEEMDRSPGAGNDAQERIASLILEPDVLDRVIAAVREIIRTGTGTGWDDPSIQQDSDI
jgi:hypothetical protein